MFTSGSEDIKEDSGGGRNGLGITQKISRGKRRHGTGEQSHGKVYWNKTGGGRIKLEARYEII